MLPSAATRSILLSSSSRMVRSSSTSSDFICSRSGVRSGLILTTPSSERSCLIRALCGLLGMVGAQQRGYSSGTAIDYSDARTRTQREREASVHPRKLPVVSLLECCVASQRASNAQEDSRHTQHSRAGTKAVTFAVCTRPSHPSSESLTGLPAEEDLVQRLPRPVADECSSVRAGARFSRRRRPREPLLDARPPAGAATASRARSRTSCTPSRCRRAPDRAGTP